MGNGKLNNLLCFCEIPEQNLTQTMWKQTSRVRSFPTRLHQNIAESFSAFFNRIDNQNTLRCNAYTKLRCSLYISFLHQKGQETQSL
jgi:hypothetical protein